MRPLALLWLVTAVAGAQDPELDRFERDYRSQRDTAVRPLLVTYAERLRALHASLSQRNEPRAADVRTELDQVTSRLAHPAGSPPQPPPAAQRTPANPPSPPPAANATVDLRGQKAALAAGAVFNDKVLAAVQFRGEKATATWEVPAFKPGRYKVRLDCGCPVGLGAVAQIAFGNRPPSPFTVLPTSESGQAVGFNFGEIELPPGVTTVKVTMTGIPPRTKGPGGFNLHLISISPAEPPRATPQ